MKKVFYASAIALALGIFAPAVTSQATTNSQVDSQPDYIAEIRSSKVNKDNATIPYSTVVVKDQAVPVYEISNGAMKVTNRKAMPKSEWVSINTLTTESGKIYYQVADNSFIFGNLDEVNLVFSMPLLVQMPD